MWWVAETGDLPPAVSQTIEDPRSEVLLSAASAWEIAILRAAGRLEAPADIVTALAASGIEPLPVTIAHAERAGSLPRIHGDPFDRMLVAQAQIEGLTIVTRDAQIPRYDVSVLVA